MRSPVLSLVFLSLCSAGSLQSRPVDLSIPSGGHGPIDSRGYAQHWIELTEVDFGQGLSLPLRLNLLSARLGSHGFGAGLWQSPLLSAGILTRSEKQISILLPCGKVLTLISQGKNPGRFATPDGEWVGVVKGPRTLVSREDGWELEFDQRGLLFRLRADSGRNILWNRLADGSVRTITEVAQNGIVSTGLTVTWDAATKRITTLEARTAAGVKPWKLGYMGGQRLTQVTFPDRSAENIRYSTDATGNPMMSIASRSLTPLSYVWDKTKHTLISDGLWTYQFKHGKGDVYPVTTRISPGGEKEIFHDDFKNGRTLFTSADGTLTTRQNVTAPGPAQGKLATVTRLTAGAKAAITLYQATHDPQTGMLTEESNALGRKTTHVYELHGPTPHSGVKRHTQINPLGHKSIRDFDTHGNLLASTDPLGHTTRHEYNTQNRRIKTTGPDGSVVEILTYNAQGKVETRMDALGAVTKYGYDAEGNRTSTTDALGNVTQDSYDTHGNRIATTNVLGHTWKFEHDAGGRLIRTVVPALAGSDKETATTYTYDPQGRRLRTTAPDGNVTEATTYDAFGRVISRTDALGHVTKFEYDLKRGSIGCASCSSSSQPTHIISPSGRITERIYDLDHHLLTETIAPGTAEATTTKHSYDLAGNRLSSTDPLGRVTRFEYDATNQCTVVIHPDQTKRSFAYNANGELIAETDELGHTTKRDYDAYGNLIAITDPAGHTTRTLFGSGDDSSPNLKADDSSALHGYAALHRPTGTVSAAGIRTSIEYDALGRRIAITKAPGTPDASTARHEYDAVGNEIATITNIGANQEPGTNNQEQKTTYTYDSRNRRLTTTDALNRTLSFFYNDNASSSGFAPCCGADPTSNTRAVEIVHPDGSKETRTHNAAGQLIATMDAKGDTVRYSYDLEGRLAELTDANGHTTKWRYNVRGKLAAKTYPDQTTELYEHDAAGQMVSRVRPDGTSARYTYDDRSRLLKIEWSDGKTENSTFAYDKAGHLTLAQNNSATIQRSYNTIGRMAQETQKISSPVAPQLDNQLIAAVGYKYDADGRLSQLSYPYNTTVSYRYNERGELSEVQDSMPQAPGSKPGTARYTRSPDGKITQLALPNGTVTTKTYDEGGRLSEIKHRDPKGNTLFSETSRYDLKNRRTARVQADGSADLFAYDPAGQVIAAAYAQASSTAVLAASETTANSEPRTVNSPAPSFKPQQTFKYDAAGNRLEATDNGTTTKYTPNVANQYTQITTGTQIVEPQFDKLGNLLHDDKNTYTWDADIHLLSVETQSNIKEQASSITKFKYDALHRRAARYESATKTTTLFIHDGWNVIAEYQSATGRNASTPLPDSNSPRLSSRHTWGEDLSGSLQGAGGIAGLLASVHQPLTIVYDSKPPPTLPMWFHYDSNGNVILLSDADGKESARYQYDAFGKTILAQGTVANLNRYQFSTKPMERLSGLAFYGFRYYSPELGRWPNRDPFQENGGINLDQIVGNAPVNSWDYLGLYPYPCDCDLIQQQFDGLLNAVVNYNTTSPPWARSTNECDQQASAVADALRQQFPCLSLFNVGGRTTEWDWGIWTNQHNILAAVVSAELVEPTIACSCPDIINKKKLIDPYKDRNGNPPRNKEMTVEEFTNLYPYENGNQHPKNL